MSYIQDFFHFVSAWRIWHSLFHDFTWFDWVLTVLCAAGFFTGIFRGFGFFFGKLVGLLVLIFTVLLIAPALADWTAAALHLDKGPFLEPLFFFLLTVLLVFALRKLSQLQSKGLVHFHPFWDRIVGAAAGFFLALLFISFISQFFLLLPLKTLHATYEKEGSRFGTIARDFVPQLIEGVLIPVRLIVNHRVSHA